MKLGLEKLLDDRGLQQALQAKRIGIVGHPASVTAGMVHSLDALMSVDSLRISAAFGPQHGMRGDKQDNMVESPDYLDPRHQIPVFSLYGDTRRPTPAMMDHCDVILFDVQDIGCRIYTYATTLLYMMEACMQARKPLWVLDRPNPAGRSVEGTLLQPGWESFVGAAPILMRHGITLGEMARWYAQHFNMDIDLHIITMEAYHPHDAPGYGWPAELAWVNPSPNASSLNMARCFPGTVLLEATQLSEGRGTTIPLEVVGAPDIDIQHILTKMEQLAPQWLRGILLRPCYFEPTFHKHTGKLCQGLQIHTDTPHYRAAEFKPFRFMCLFLKSLRLLDPPYNLWRKHAYEYEQNRLPMDLINGGPFIREWIDDPQATPADLEQRLKHDEQIWQEQIQQILLY